MKSKIIWRQTLSEKLNLLKKIDKRLKQYRVSEWLDIFGKPVETSFWLFRVYKSPGLQGNSQMTPSFLLFQFQPNNRFHCIPSMAFPTGANIRLISWPKIITTAIDRWERGWERGWERERERERVRERERERERDIWYWKENEMNRKREGI